MPTGEASDRRTALRADADRRAHHDAIYTLARAAELHDEDTGAHVLRIRHVVERVAARLGVPDAEALGYDAMLHDAGKLTIPLHILGKPEALTAEERRIMERHTVAGERILADRPSLARAARIARSHHECWDGSGYPDGLAGDRIPPEAWITAAADVLDALVSDRCYKRAWSSRAALDRLRALAGTSLHPAAVEAILEVSAAGGLDEAYAPA